MAMPVEPVFRMCGSGNNGQRRSDEQGCPERLHLHLSCLREAQASRH